MQRAAVLLLVLAGCHAGRPTPAARPPLVEASWIDKSADPCDDFYQYSCGGWLARTKLEPQQSWYAAFLEYNKTDAALRKILDGAAAGRGDRKLGDFWAACLADAGSPDVLRAELDAIQVGRPDELARTTARMQLAEATPFFQVSASQDAHDPSGMILNLNQGGLGISSRNLSWISDNRDYYLTDAHAKVRELYLDHVGKMLALAGSPDAATGARRVLAFETALARGYLSNADTDEPALQDHPMETRRLVELAPHFAWAAYFTALGLPEIARVNVQSPAFLQALDGALAHAGADDLRVYLSWQFLHAHAQALGPAFDAEDFRFRSQALTGQLAAPLRWSVCLEDANRLVGETLGRAYAETALGAAARDEARALVGSIAAAFRSRLAVADWMDDETRARALAKLNLVGGQIGYPDGARDLNEVAIDRRSYLADVLAAAQANARHELAWVGRPADRAALSWRFMHPQTFDAMFDPQLNQMLFPAAILQPPFFVAGMGAGNLPGIGWVMGHELTHGFDRFGRRYDGEGRLAFWWTQKAERAFAERAACFVDQYAKIEIAPGVHVDGEQTLKENIADNNALRLTWDAWKAAPHAGDDRQFFVSMAQGFCSVARDELLRSWSTTRSISWWKLRAVVPMMNLPAFAETFQCKPGARMAPEKRCAVY